MTPSERDRIAALRIRCAADRAALLALIAPSPVLRQTTSPTSDSVATTVVITAVLGLLLASSKKFRARARTLIQSGWLAWRGIALAKTFIGAFRKI